jgi:putative methionine-R-sulfoxide reductase with GAF domain
LANFLIEGKVLPMSDSLKVLLDKQPPWFFQASSGVLLLILLVFLYWAFKGAKNYAEAVNKENKIVTLLDERNKIQNEQLLLRAITDQLCVVIENGTTFVRALNDYNPFNTDAPSVSKHIQSVIESMATDIKTVVGEKHRCGFWVNNDEEDEDVLTLFNGSSAFPYGYENVRFLNLNHSIAGRSFRKKETLYIEDVAQDPDWSLSDNPSSYTSLICIPISTWGVITIDAKQKMSHNTVLIGEFYASIIEGFLNKFSISQLTNFTINEAAVANEEIPEGGEDSEQ